MDDGPTLVEVPSVIGDTIEFATGRLSAIGSPVMVEPVDGLMGDPNIVVEQLPLPGSSVVIASPVVLKVPGGSPTLARDLIEPSAEPTTTTTEAPTTTTTTTQAPAATTTTTTTTSTTKPPLTDPDTGVEIRFEGVTPGRLIWQTGWMVDAGLLGPECVGHGLGGYSSCAIEFSYIEASGADLGVRFHLSSKPIATVVVDVTWDPTEIIIGPAAGGCALVDESVTSETLRLTLEPDGWRSVESLVMSGAGDGIDDGDQVTEIRLTVVDELSDPAYHDAEDLVAHVTTVDRPDGAICH